MPSHSKREDVRETGWTCSCGAFNPSKFGCIRQWCRDCFKRYGP